MNLRIVSKYLECAFIKEKTLVDAFSEHCETLRWFVDTSSRHSPGAGAEFHPARALALCCAARMEAEKQLRVYNP